ncbi:MAG: pyridoxamine 5'-phosphate oxidase family protein [Bacteroidales bacterium]|jgi:nitroimidazol reductase NimA-like FMN-containing flavoprotein (pyridoxamine 5'-phosphate oxidase superfamily)
MDQYHLQNRPDRELTSKEEIGELLKTGKYVTIALCRNYEPYIVTLSYGYDPEKNALYFHTAKKGLKLDFLLENPNVCATIIEDNGYIADECAHAYRSVVFWGDIRIVGDMDEKKHGMLVLLNHLENKQSVIKEKMLKSDSRYSGMEILRLDIKQIHGKAGR